MQMTIESPVAREAELGEYPKSSEQQGLVYGIASAYPGRHQCDNSTDDRGQLLRAGYFWRQ